jgi:hypothetical protein
MVSSSMRGRFVLVFAALVVGCSTDSSGLGGDLVDLDAQVADSTTMTDETSQLFPGDDGGTEDTSIPATDSEPADTFVPPIDSELPDTFVPDTFVPDTFVPDTFVPDTFVPDTFVADTAPETFAIDAPASDGALSPSPGLVDCTGKTCASGEVCCASGSTFVCTTMCGTIVPAGYRCDEKADCPGQVCCADVSWGGDWYGSHCVGAGYCWTAQLCSSSADCSGGKICTPTKPTGAPTTMGYCK